MIMIVFLMVGSRLVGLLLTSYLSSMDVLHHFLRLGSFEARNIKNRVGPQTNILSTGLHFA